MQAGVESAQMRLVSCLIFNQRSHLQFEKEKARGERGKKKKNSNLRMLLELVTSAKTLKSRSECRATPAFSSSSSL